MSSSEYPKVMRAVVTAEPKTVSVQEVPVPALEPGEVLVKIATAALNPTDWKHATFVAPGKITGCDFAGQVVQVADDVHSLKAGDRVAGLVHGSAFTDRGAFAEYTKTFADVCCKLPDNISFEDAATLPVGVGTAIQAMFHPTRLNLPWPAASSPSPWFLIYGGSTSVGMFAIQLAHRAGYRVVTTCSPRNFELVKSFGADAAFDYRSGTWVEDVRKATGDSLHHVLDTVSTDDDTSKAITSAFAPGPGKLLTIVAVREAAQSLRPDVEMQRTFLYSAFGLPFNVAGNQFPAAPEDRTHHASWQPKITELVRDGLKANPVKVWPGGLNGVADAYQYMKEGKVSAEKVVFVV